jgi:DNA-binding NarL/FixJ family response regulator
MALRCLIVDDNPEFLRAARDLLERQGISVVAVAATGEEAVARARDLRPDFALVDIELGEESGFALVQRLAAEDGDLARNLILISTHDADEFAELIEASPAAGFVAKSDVAADAIEALLARRSE